MFVDIYGGKQDEYVIIASSDWALFLYVKFHYSTHSITCYYFAEVDIEEVPPTPPREPSPEPEPILVESEEEAPAPAEKQQPVTNTTTRRRKRRRKHVDKTYLDDDGFMGECPIWGARGVNQGPHCTGKTGKMAPKKVCRSKQREF